MSFDEPTYHSPLGEVVRREDWYRINEAFASITVVVYPGELIAVSEKAYNYLKTGVPLGDDGQNEFLLVHYTELVPLLEQNGFARL